MDIFRGGIHASWHWLTKPSPVLLRADQRHHAQLLAGLLVVIGPIALIIGLLGLHPAARALIGEPELALALGLGLFSLIPYLINRSGRVQLAARLVVYVAALAIYGIAVIENNALSTNSLLRILIPLLIGSFFFAVRELSLLAVSILAGVLMLPLFAPTITLLEILTGPFPFLLVMAILIVLCSLHRDRLDAAQQSYLTEQETRHRQILEATFDTILTHHDGHLLEASPGFQKLFGYTRPTNLLLDDLIVESLRSVQADNAKICETRMRRQDGSIFFAELITIQQPNPHGPSAITAVRDVSRARRVEEALRESERRFRLLTEHSPDFVYIWQAGTDRVPYFNQDGFLGYTHEELTIPGYLASATYPDDWAALQTHWQSVLRHAEAEIARPIEYRIRHKQGHWEWLERRDTVIAQDTDAQPEQVLITLRIITERKRAEEDLRAAEAQNRALLDAIPDSILHVKRDGTLIHARSSKSPGDYAPDLSPAALRGKRLQDFVEPNLGQMILQAIQQTLDSGEIQIREYEWAHDDSSHHFESRWVACGPDEVIAVVRDVTERHRREDQLRREASIYQNVFEAIIVTRLDKGEYRIQSMNHAAQKLYGWSEDEVRGQVFYEVFKPEYLPNTTRAEALHQIATAGYWTDEVTHRRRDGTPVDVLISVTLLRDADGSPAGTVVIALDTTERRRAEAALRMSEERFQTALKGSPIVVSNQALDLRYTWIHSPVLKFDPSEVIGKRDSDLLERPEDAAQIELLKQQVIDSGSGLRRAVRWQEKGEMRHYDLTIEPLRDTNGAIIGITCAQVDMTERVREEEARQKIQHLLQSIIGSVPMVIWSVNRDGIVTLAEGLGLREMGLETSQVVGKSIYNIFPQEPPLLTDIQRALSGEALTSFSTINRVDYQTLYRPVFDSAGQVDSLVMVTIDISERIRAEHHQLDLALERERINLLQRFMGDVSHDFKTPLTSIKLSIYLLKRITDEIRRERHMQVIEMQASRLEKLVNDLFTMSRLDQSITGEFNFAPLDMNELLNELLIAHDPLVQVKQHSLQFEPGDAIPATFGDPFQLDRLFTNLLINAVNYTPEGGQIIVRTRYHDGEIIAEMQDNGIGIAPEEHERIFNRFYRADPARSSEHGGMGVGLSIARKIVEAHGGRIELDSAPGKGSTFRVLLPVIAAK